MRRLWWYFVLSLGAAAWPFYSSGQEAGPGAVVVLQIKGPIGPATSDYVSRGLRKAAEMRAELVVLRLDTPGGLDTAMRQIIQDILASPVPVATFVAPSGARAASAGTFILYASHVAAMAPATNLGAATPVQIGGPPGAPQRPAPPKGPEEQHKEDKTADEQQAGKKSAEHEEAEPPKAQEPADALKRKQVSDAVAYIRSLAQMRGRNVEWAEKAVREAASLSAEEAVEQNVADLLADDLDDLLAKLDGRTVNVLGQDRALKTKERRIVEIAPDWRNRLLSIITDPNVAYILMMLGVYGLFFELANPGYILPGVLGAICLLLALYAFQVLPVNYAGVALVILGIAFMLAEAFMPSFGALGIGGAVAFVVGSLILVDTDVEGFRIAWPVIAGVAVLSFLFFSVLVAMAVRARRRRVVSGREELIGSLGEALESFKREGRVRVHSEDWMAYTHTPVRRGQRVRVIGVDGLILNVEPESSGEQS